MLLKIITQENPLLRKKSKEIPKITKRIKDLAKDMLDTMYEANGVGLAAPQVGVLERLVVIDVGDGPFIMINPKIIAKSGENKDVEGCLSIPGRSEYICRAEQAEASFIDLTGKQKSVKGTGLLARAFQHEIDHLDGILFVDYLKKE